MDEHFVFLLRCVGYPSGGNFGYALLSLVVDGQNVRTNNVEEKNGIYPFWSAQTSTDPTTQETNMIEPGV